MRVVGIDISDATIEVLELRHLFGGMAVKSVSRSKLPSGIVTDSIIKDMKALTTHLQTTFDEAQPQPLKVNSAYFAIPESKVFTHVFTFPRELKEDGIQDAIQIQFSEYFPFSLDETAYDWKTVQVTDQTQMVFVGACEKIYIKQLNDLSKAMNIRINGVDIESASTARALLPHAKGIEAYMLVDLGANVSSMSIFDTEGLQSTFALNSGGKKLTQQIAKKRNISFDEAEKLKKQMNLEDKNNTEHEDLVSIVHDQLKPVIAEIKRSIEFFEGSRKKSVKSIILCGGMSIMSGLVTYVDKQIDIPVTIGDPLTHITQYDILKKQERKEVIFYSNVIGLTLGVVDRKYHHTRFNFLSHYTD